MSGNELEEAATESDHNAEEHDDEESDETSSECLTEDGEDSSPGGTKKKKKKKKKKKSKGEAAAPAAAADTSAADSGPSTSGSPGSSKAEKAESEKRFLSALEDVKSGEMWIKLASCNIFDAKTKKLFDALKGNNTVTSLDLSQNHISDDGAQAIATVLGMNGAPSLIELDLRENTFTDSGLTVLEGLKRLRKHLDLKVGSLTPPAAVEEVKDMTKGPMFRRYFQSGDEVEEEPSSSYSNDQENQSMMDGGLSPEELWGKIELLVRGGKANIPELTPCLQHLMLLLQREVSTLQVHYADSAVDGTRPHIKGCVHHLATLDAILCLAPDPVTAQYADTPQPAVGTHRLWAAEVLALMLGPGNTVIDRCVAAARLVPRTLHLSLRHPLCSALHTRALRVLRSCCVSRVPDMLAPLLTHGFGAGLLKGGAGDGLEPCEPLHVQLAHWGTEVVDTPSGRRSPVVGFVMELCKVLMTCCEESNKEVFNANLKKVLTASDTWQAFSCEGGPLPTLCQQQEGDLGGPRPLRLPAEEGGSAMADMAGGGLISGHEILALLQGMSGMNVLNG